MTRACLVFILSRIAPLVHSRPIQSTQREATLLHANVLSGYSIVVRKSVWRKWHGALFVFSSKNGDIQTCGRLYGAQVCQGARCFHKHQEAEVAQQVRLVFCIEQTCQMAVE